MRKNQFSKLMPVAAVLAMAGCASRSDVEISSSPPTRRMAPSTPNESAAAHVSGITVTRSEPAEALTLQSALALALEENPLLQTFSWQERANEARGLQAGLFPNPQLGLEVEDVLGTGTFQGGQEAQTTLQLSQVIELGGKRKARREAAAQLQGVTQSEYESRRVEVLGDVTQRFIRVVAMQHALDLAQTNRRLAEDALRTVQARVSAGAASALEERKAQVALARGELLVEGAQHDLDAARNKLASSWGNKVAVFTRAEGDLFAPPALPSFETFANRIAQSPEILRWVSEHKLREAELKLAESRRIPDVIASAGVRRLEGPSDEAFVFGLSVPLQLFDRNQAGTAEARALLGKSEAERRAAEARLTTVLLGIYEEMVHDAHIMEGLQREILPKAEDALAIAQAGFAQGRFSYLEVLDAQRTIFDVKQEYIQTACSHHQFRVELERLTGQPLEGNASAD